MDVGRQVFFALASETESPDFDGWPTTQICKTCVRVLGIERESLQAMVQYTYALDIELARCTKCNVTIAIVD